MSAKIKYQRPLSPNLAENLEIKYKDAIFALNQLQTNATTLEMIQSAQKCNLVNSCEIRFQQNYDFLARSGLSMLDLDKLSVIHIAGTKGKGSTSAYCESILRHHGYKTGFFSSPHLISVRERIRINGKPIDIPTFLKHFWPLYNKLNDTKTHERDLPAYFQFLTLIAFHTFLKEEVDVAIFEVGIGGEYDTTNILRKVPVVGITSLGLDHTEILGATMEEITWHKSGIMKPGCEAYSVDQTDKNIWHVLENRSVDKKCSLKKVPKLEEYQIDDWEPFKHLIEVQKLNISLAVQLAYAWLKKTDRKKINLKTLMGIENCRWPGRTQILNTTIGNFYLDGAHTTESIQVCVDWFKDRTKLMPMKRILIFNMTGRRDPKQFLQTLSRCNFDEVYFTPNMVDVFIDPKSDQTSFKNPDTLQYQRCEEHRKLYEDLTLNTCVVKVFPSIRDLLESLDESEKVILVTGSLHLIGGVLGILDPNLELSNS